MEKATERREIDVAGGGMWRDLFLAASFLVGVVVEECFHKKAVSKKAVVTRQTSKSGRYFIEFVQNSASRLDFHLSFSVLQSS